MNLEDIQVRTSLQPGDIGYIIYQHGHLYGQEFGFGIEFETYVARGLIEFWEQYDPAKDGIWICEHENRIVGFLFLMHRGDTAQLRYFIIEPAYRGLGLGKKLMVYYMAHLKKCHYQSSYLLTTHELKAAANLYTRHGFKLTEENQSSAFGKLLTEQRYDWVSV